MIDVKLIRSDPEGIKSAMARRGVDPSEVDQVIVADEGWRQVLAAQEASRSAVKSLSKKFGEAKRSGDEGLAATVAEQSRIEGEKQTELGRKAQQAEDTRRDLLLRLPNLPDPQAPQGDGPEDNPTVKWWAPFPLGDKPDATIESHFAEHQRVPHWEIGAELGILDMERGAKLSGAMFPMFRGMGATLVRALIGWALNSHSNQDGPFGAFEEVRPPTLVRTETMISTGALPKFADDAYHLERDDLWAIPTAEVPLTSLARDEILAQGDLPRLMTAYTPCYRREAGSAGKDTRGLLRVHEFDKVEILAYSTPGDAKAVHEELMRRAEGLIQELGLAYRVIDLCAGDLGNSAARTYDIEVYSPGCGLWLEVSSVSWFSDYQARRANIRYRIEDSGTSETSGVSKELGFVHTLNGSAVAVPRVWAAIVETYRQPDGSVELPECLVGFTGQRRTIS